MSTGEAEPLPEDAAEPPEPLHRPDRRSLPPGLHFIATPIGAARDITLRALDILAAADVLAAEDTRTLRRLMEIHGVPLAGRPLLAYHDHNGEQMRPRLLRALEEGKSVAYASEAGTPLVADPGFQLSRAAIAAGFPVLAAPGPSAVLAALTVAGLPSDRFLFAGFPPAAAGARRRFFAELAGIPATLVFYESPKRVSRSLGEMAEAFGNREAAVCRELTKRFEEVTRGPLQDLVAAFADRSVKGEIVVLVDRAQAVVADAASLEAALEAALQVMSVKDAAAEVAQKLGLPRRDVYQLALRLAEEGVMGRQVRGEVAYFSGLHAEDAVARVYARSGRPIAATRWRGAAGEIDLIARDGAEVIFIEVKKSASHAEAAERLSRRQMERIYASASEFLAGEPAGQLTEARFDVALVDARGAVEIIENAFAA